MREIKFRAWDKITSSLITNDKIMVDSGICWVKSEDGKHSTRLIDAKLMQYTGLLDKKGVEIYEGDIVESSDDVVWGLGEVIFRNTSFRVHAYILAELHDIEVIGNIYESPELLNG